MIAHSFTYEHFLFYQNIKIGWQWCAAHPGGRREWKSGCRGDRRLRLIFGLVAQVVQQAAYRVHGLWLDVRGAQATTGAGRRDAD